MEDYQQALMQQLATMDATEIEREKLLSDAYLRGEPLDDIIQKWLEEDIGNDSTGETNSGPHTDDAGSHEIPASEQSEVP